jgi:hypothetical protein
MVRAVTYRRLNVGESPRPKHQRLEGPAIIGVREDPDGGTREINVGDLHRPSCCFGTPFWSAWPYRGGAMGFTCELLLKDVFRRLLRTFQKYCN